ncbi:uncharacterized protein HKW66_Vig0196380 [Vigna angularis]|uniref:Uncharacterized protein n=1 Tax=Phaseolus angularis TaxID=3914 RepID=A0A8T0KNR1_PHAAN|nr:uncharacterized protein HKW66_Vig0196380 [Vigna angularis]
MVSVNFGLTVGFTCLSPIRIGQFRSEETPQTEPSPSSFPHTVLSMKKGQNDSGACADRVAHASVTSALVPAVTGAVVSL